MKYIDKTGLIRWGENLSGQAWKASDVFRDAAPGLLTEDGASYWVRPERPSPSQPWRLGGGRPGLYPNGELGGTSRGP